VRARLPETRKSHPVTTPRPPVRGRRGEQPAATAATTAALPTAPVTPTPTRSGLTVSSLAQTYFSAHARPIECTARPRSSQVSPTTYSGVSPPTQENRLPSLSSLSAVSPLTALWAAPVSLTPSLGRLYREQLIGHVLGWPAEHLEKASNKVNEEHHNISSHAITKVSAELKMARSLVRILFLRQQSTDLEGLGRPQHARVDHASRDNRDRDRLHDQASRDHESRDHFASSNRNHVTRETNHATTSHGYLSRGTSRDHDSWPGRELHK